MKTKVAVIMITLFLASITAVTIPVGAAGTIYVYPGDSIQAAIDAASPGSTIVVEAGEYHQSVVVKKSIRLSGWGAILDGTPPADPGTTLGVDGITIAQGVSFVTIEYFEIRDYTATGTGQGNGIQAWNRGTSDVKVIGNIIHHNSWNGILVGNEGEGLHQRWIIKYNVVYNNGYYNIELTNGQDSVISGNTVTGPGAHGILVQARNFDFHYLGDPLPPETVTSCRIKIEENTVSGFDFNGIYLIAIAGGTSGPRNAVLSSVTVFDNEVYGNWRGIVAWGYSGTWMGTLYTESDVTNVLVKENNVHDNTGPGIWLRGRVTYSRVLDNIVNENERGIVLSNSDNNRISGNIASDNTTYGIMLITDSDDNTINKWNTSFGNGTFDLFQEAGCDNNIWINNDFGTSSGI